MEKTQIQIKKETREKLKNRGKKGETYDDIIDNMIEDDNNGK